MKVFLTVIIGPLKGKSFSVSGGESIGREKGDIVLSDPKVSNPHAIVKKTFMGKLILVDQKSKNGMKVNGKRIDKLPLELGKTFQIGANYFCVEAKRSKTSKNIPDSKTQAPAQPSVKSSPLSSKPKTETQSQEYTPQQQGSRAEKVSKPPTDWDRPETGLSENTAIRQLADEYSEEFSKTSPDTIAYGESEEKSDSELDKPEFENEPDADGTQSEQTETGQSIVKTEVKLLEQDDSAEKTQSFDQVNSGEPVEDRFTETQNLEPEDPPEDFDEVTAQYPGSAVSDDDWDPTMFTGSLDDLIDSTSLEASDETIVSEQSPDSQEFSDSSELVSSQDSDLTFVTESSEPDESKPGSATITTEQAERSPQEVTDDFESSESDLSFAELGIQYEEADSLNPQSSIYADESTATVAEVPENLNAPARPEALETAPSVRTLQEKQHDTEQTEQKEHRERWNHILENFARDHIKSVQSEVVEMQAFSAPVKMVFYKGIQAETEWFLGYGPRFVGRQSLDLPLFEEKAPESIAFSLYPSEKGAQFRTDFPELVRLNGSSQTDALVKSGDVISIEQTEIEIEIL